MLVTYTKTSLEELHGTETYRSLLIDFMDENLYASRSWSISFLEGYTQQQPFIQREYHLVSWKWFEYFWLDQTLF